MLLRLQKYEKELKQARIIQKNWGNSKNKKKTCKKNRKTLPSP